MKKGCIIGLAILAVLLIIGVIASVFLFKKGMGFANSGIAYGLEELIKEHQEQNPGAQVATTNEAWAAVLKGKTMEIEGGRPVKLDDLIHEGKFVDVPGRNPMIFSKGPNGEVRISMVGKDKLPGTDDDVDSSAIRNLLEKAKAN